MFTTKNRKVYYLINRRVYYITYLNELLYDISFKILDADKRRQAFDNYHKIIESVPEFTTFVFENNVVNGRIESTMIEDGFPFAPSNTPLKRLLQVKNLTNKCNIVLHKEDEDIINTIILDILKYDPKYIVKYRNAN